jgi:hypothetical protein
LLLRILDYRSAGVGILVCIGVLSVVRYIKFGSWAKLNEVINAALGLVVLWSGIIAASVLLLTSPPAIDQISEHALVLVGLVSFIVCVAVGFREVRNVFFPASSNQNAGHGPSPVPLQAPGPQGVETPDDSEGDG